MTVRGTFINVDAKGFRGGAGRKLGGNASLTNNDYRSLATAHGSKGEGIAGTPRYVVAAGATSLTDAGKETYPEGSNAMGAPANAGGGGTDGSPSNNAQNAGGGGGANGGAGGRGGNTWSSNRVTGGFGGAAFTNHPARFILGGGGGAGSTNDGSGGLSEGLASSGGAGGGLVMISVGSISGTGTISVSGESARNVDQDGAGGAGAGGSVYITATKAGSSLTGITVNAKGGNGGNAWSSQSNSSERHGPGGGGGGGVIYSNTPLSSNSSVTGGANGTTTTSSDAYGAKVGEAGVIKSGAPAIVQPFNTILDLDADDDGITNINEYGGIDPFGDADNDGVPNLYDTTPGTGVPAWRDANGDGIHDFFDTDGDGIINSEDLDSDGDGIPDIVEAGGTDADNDGKIDDPTDANGDGLRDAAGVNGLIPADFDGDGIPNFRDLDSDGDGILDSRESGLAGDTNNNGILNDDAGYVDANGDGWSDAIDALPALNLTNTDGRGGPNYLDIDSDDDGITDNVEGQSTAGYQPPLGIDLDQDGIDDRYDNNTSAYGGSANNGITPYNHDGTDEPDYMDLDSDNDGDPDLIEGNDLNGNGRVDDVEGINYTDTDGDGLIDFFDADNKSADVTVKGYGDGTGSNSTAQKTIDSYTDRDWRNSEFSLTAHALPVRFIQVRAQVRNNATSIEWIVADEKDVLHYEVERSIDGSRFEKIGTVAYKQAVFAENTYAFTDAAFAQQNRYYRIRQVDIDGKSMYSATVLVRANNRVGVPVLQLYPNPATSASVIMLEARNQQKVQVTVVDVKGQVVARQMVQVQKGSNLIPAGMLQPLAPGMYILVADVDGQRQQVKFIK